MNAELFSDLEMANAFLILVEWYDKKAKEAHMKSDYFKVIVSELETYLIEAFEVKMYERLL